MLDAVDVGDGVLDQLGHLRLKFGRRRARLRDVHRDERHVDVRKARDRERLKLMMPSTHSTVNSRIAGTGLRMEIGREIDAACRSFGGADFAGFRNDGAHDVAIAQECAGPGDDHVAALRPSLISTMPPEVSPVVTVRVSTLSLTMTCAKAPSVL